MAAAKNTYVIKQADGTEIEVEGTRAEQDKASTRVTIFDGDDQVGSFINTQSWHRKAPAA